MPVGHKRREKDSALKPYAAGSGCLGGVEPFIIFYVWRHKSGMGLKRNLEFSSVPLLVLEGFSWFLDFVLREIPEQTTDLQAT